VPVGIQTRHVQMMSPPRNGVGKMRPTALPLHLQAATGHLGGGRPNAAALGALNSTLVDPSGIGDAKKVAPIPPPRIRVSTIPQFK
jgi:hypothetical protein